MPARSLTSTLALRQALQLVVDRTSQLVDYLKDAGSRAPQNVDQLLLRESMDVIGARGSEDNFASQH